MMELKLSMERNKKNELLSCGNGTTLNVLWWDYGNMHVVYTQNWVFVSYKGDT